MPQTGKKCCASLKALTTGPQMYGAVCGLPDRSGPFETAVQHLASVTVYHCLRVVQAVRACMHQAGRLAGPVVHLAFICVRLLSLAIHS